MERRNYFEILGLDFDPPEKKPQVIKKSIAAWEKRTQDRLANETNATRRAALQEELSLRSDMETVLGENKSRNLEARSLKEKRVAQLEQLIEIMRTGETGTLEVTHAQIRNVCLKLRLSPQTVEDIYTKKDFIIQKRNKKINLNEVFISKTTADNVSENLTKLKTMHFHQFDWTGKVRDMFDFACFYSGGKESDLAGFRKKRTGDLLSIMEAGSAKYAADLSDQGHLLNELFSAGMTQVFNSEENRKKYGQTLEREKLSGFFALLKTAPEDFKKDRYFAESCIRTIQKHFPDYNLALALYNQEAGLMQDPYEPIEALIRVVCASCQTPAEFRTHEEAQRGQCAVCGTKLYIKCPKCGKMAPTAADRCACGFQISEMQFFEDYCRAAQFALTDLDLEEAERQYQNAELAHPGHPNLRPLADQIKSAKSKFGQALRDLDELIDQGMLGMAQTALTRVAAAMPRLKLDGRRRKIAEALDLAQKRMPPANASPADRANRCLDILQTVKDFQPAIDVVRMVPPRPPLNLMGITRDDGRLTCTLSWNAAGDKSVTYQVVRKREGVPVRASDGEVLAKNLTVLEFKDASLQPGISYGYAVFACRYGTYSEPATCEVENFSDLNSQTIKHFADDGACRFSWELPTNCVGVRVLRRTNAMPTTQLGGGTTIVAERAQTGFHDTNVVNGTGYGYRLQCIYPYKNGFKYSSGYPVMLYPDAPPVSVRNIKAKVEGRQVTLSWQNQDLVERNVVVQEANNPGVSGIRGQNLSCQQIYQQVGSGRIYASVPSTARQCQFEIPSSSVVSLAVITFSGSRGIVSDVIQVSSVERCEIDKLQTRIDGERLVITLSNLPKNLNRIYYTVAKKMDSRVPWSTIDDAKQNHMSVVTVGDYVRDGMIVVERPAKTDLYLTVIGQYKMADASVVYSEPSRHRINNKPKEVIRYQMMWGGGFWGAKAKNARLVIRTNAPATPQMKLICRTDGHIPMKLTDPANLVLHAVPETERGFADGEYVYTFDDAIWTSLNKGTELRLMLQAEDLLEYEVLAENVKSLKVP